MSKNKENKLVPKLRFPEFEYDREWNENPFEKFCLSISSGKDKNIINGKYELYGSTGIIGEAENASYDGNFILVARVGANAGLLNKVKGKFGVTDNTLVIDLINKDLIDFIFYTLDNVGLDKLVFGSGQPLITGGQLKSLLLSTPNSEQEQQKIASCLSSLDEVIAAENQKLELWKEHKKGLLQGLFPSGLNYDLNDEMNTMIKKEKNHSKSQNQKNHSSDNVPKLRFKEFEGSGEWVEKKLGEIGENLDNKRVPITENVREKGDVPYYGASGIIDYVKDFIFEEDLLCVSEDGANLVVRNYPIAFSIKGQTWVNNHAHVLKFENKATQIIVESYLNATDIKDFLTGAAQPKLNQGQLDIIPIPIPPSLSEQEKIASCLSSLDDLITAQNQKIETLKQHKKGLLQGLFPALSEL